MWIIPSTLNKQYSALVLGNSVSKEVSKALVHPSRLRLMWKSKPLLSSTLSRLWSRVYWIPRLFGQIVKPSLTDHFATKYTASLPVIRASHSALPASEKAQTTLDTCGRIFTESSNQLDLFGGSSKTWPSILIQDTKKYQETYAKLVTLLKKTSLQRQKLARHTNENDFLYLQWTTPVSTDINRNTKYQQGGTALSLQVKGNWTTPISRDYCHPKERNCKGSEYLRTQIRMYPTPYASMVSKYGSTQSQDSLEVMARDGRLALGPGNTSGKHQGLLNPAWVAQLMGTTLGKTFCECSAMEWLSKP